MSSETDCISISESTFTIKSIPNTNASSLSRATSAAAVRVPFPHSSNYQNSPKTPFVHNNHHQNINMNMNLHRNHFSQQIYNISNKLNCQTPPNTTSAKEISEIPRITHSQQIYDDIPPPPPTHSQLLPLNEQIFIIVIFVVIDIYYCNF